jgi:hypothetical protein
MVARVEQINCCQKENITRDQNFQISSLKYQRILHYFPGSTRCQRITLLLAGQYIAYCISQQEVFDSFPANASSLKLII